MNEQNVNNISDVQSQNQGARMVEANVLSGFSASQNQNFNSKNTKKTKFIIQVIITIIVVLSGAFYSYAKFANPYVFGDSKTLVSQMVTNLLEDKDSNGKEIENISYRGDLNFSMISKTKSQGFSEESQFDLKAFIDLKYKTNKGDKDSLIKGSTYGHIKDLTIDFKSGQNEGNNLSYRAKTDFEIASDANKFFFKINNLDLGAMADMLGGMEKEFINKWYFLDIKEISNLSTYSDTDLEKQQQIQKDLVKKIFIPENYSIVDEKTTLMGEKTITVSIDFSKMMKVLIDFAEEQSKNTDNPFVVTEEDRLEIENLSKVFSDKTELLITLSLGNDKNLKSAKVNINIKDLSSSDMLGLSNSGGLTMEDTIFNIKAEIRYNDIVFNDPKLEIVIPTDAINLQDILGAYLGGPAVYPVSTTPQSDF
jgi:hypothetical protein